MKSLREKLDYVPEPAKSADERMRICLVCDKEFLSTWSGNRVCKRCRASATWKQG